MRTFFRVSLLTLVFFSLSTFAATQEEALQWYQKIDSIQGTKNSLTKSERQELYKSARHHKVAALEVIGQYDPTGEIGFCFGRAMTVHLIARRMGLASEGVRKLFAIGDLRSGDNPECAFMLLHW